MPKGPIRRGQLIAPFGVGAMVVVKDGTSLVTGGLDYWFRREDGNDPSAAALDEFVVKEWRLERLLGTNHFRLPPDFRKAERGANVPNPYMTVPFLRFPTWHFCRRCHLMTQIQPNVKERPECPECKVSRNRREIIAQVPFIAVCDHGHLMDFPWREWVHKDPNPRCTGTMRLTNTGGASLAGQLLTCSCSLTAKRTLAGITGAERVEDDNEASYETALSTKLADGVVFTCRGHRAWFGTEAKPDDCGRHVRGSLRSALNVYFADVRSAIYLPRGSGKVPSDLVEALKDPALSGILSREKVIFELKPEVANIGGVVDDIVRQRPTLESGFGRALIEIAVKEVLLEKDQPTTAVSTEDDPEDEVAFRHDEQQALRTERHEHDLLVRQQQVTLYQGLSGYFDRIALADKLRETRVLNGFARISPMALPGRRDRRNLMWRRPGDPRNNWLPAQVVYGEGIYLELNKARLTEWEGRDTVKEHVAGLSGRYDALMGQRDGIAGKVTPRFLLIHTLSHLLMNQLTFSCGYSTATLRERLYISTGEGTLMGGMLIYTADGDADGTLGGLVRMGRQDHFATLLQQAIANARWCSADPICMEAGQSGGQGPDSLNLAACHSCALVPETACEEFNRLLDRTVVIGTPNNPSLGFFSKLAEVL